jgi:hypothetical protein
MRRLMHLTIGFCCLASVIVVNPANAAGFLACSHSELGTYIDVTLTFDCRKAESHDRSIWVPSGEVPWGESPDMPLDCTCNLQENPIFVGSMYRFFGKDWFKSVWDAQEELAYFGVDLSCILDCDESNYPLCGLWPEFNRCAQTRICGLGEPAFPGLWAPGGLHRRGDPGNIHRAHHLQERWGTLWHRDAEWWEGEPQHLGACRRPSPYHRCLQRRFALIPIPPLPSLQWRSWARQSPKAGFRLAAPTHRLNRCST